MALAVQVAGQASKRGIIPRVPSAERLLADIEQWLVAEYPDLVRSIQPRTTPSGEQEVLVDLHPAAPAAVFSATNGGVALSAVTAGAGPGYHRFVARLANRLAADLSIDWATDSSAESGDTPANGAPAPLKLTGGAHAPSGQGTVDERQAVERAYLGWLGHALAAAREARQREARRVHLETPPGIQYTFDGAIATCSVPATTPGSSRALADPQVAIDVRPGGRTPPTPGTS